MLKKSFFAMAAILMIVHFVNAQVPQLINYQGVLIDPATNQLVANSSYTITFSIYNVASGGSAIWNETQSVQTEDGLYSALLGSITSLTTTILSGPEKYLGIKVGGDPEMTPRKRIVSVAYAILTEDADKVDGKDASDFASASHNHDSRYYTQTELNTSDGTPPNQGSNRVSWKNLKDVPAGFADEVDNEGSGGITQINGGNAISVTNPTGPTATVAVTNNSINDDEIVDNSLTSISLATNSVGSSEIGSNAVGTSELQASVDFSPYGRVDIGNGSGQIRSSLSYSTSGGGYFEILAADGSEAIRLSTTSGANEGGWIGARDPSGNTIAVMTINTANSGYIGTNGVNGSSNAMLTSLSGYPNNGYISVQDGAGTSQAAMYVNSSGQGIVYGDTKSFRMAHPFKEDTEIWYACIEGPEAAAYVRGTARLINGRASITFPDHFQIVVQETGMTINLTPLDASSRGLAVISKSAIGFEVQELFQGSGSYEFDWEVKSVRKGYENYRVERNKNEESSSASKDIENDQVNEPGAQELKDK